MQQLKEVWLFPFMYAFSMLAVCIIMTLLYQVQKRLFPDSTHEHKIPKDSFSPNCKYYDTKETNEQRERMTMLCLNFFSPPAANNLFDSAVP